MKIIIFRVVPIIMFLLMGFAFTNKSSTEPSINPIKANDIIKISSSYGMRVHPITKEKRMHSGIDFIAKIGTPVLSTANGKVVTVEYNQTGYGNKIVIEHANNLKTVYAQLEEIKVEEGQTVNQNDIIGTVGSSGTSTGPHLHYEVLQNNIPVDPKPYLSK